MESECPRESEPGRHHVKHAYLLATCCACTPLDQAYRREGRRIPRTQNQIGRRSKVRREIFPLKCEGRPVTADWLAVGQRCLNRPAYSPPPSTWPCCPRSQCCCR
eukprot:scaffold5455_cov123-Isochrysis_galbana.AAC.1